VQVKDTSCTAQTATKPFSITIAEGPINPVITPDRTSATVVPGQPATFKLGFLGNSADAGAVFTITCQGLPQGSACSYSPSPVPLDATGVGHADLMISTAGPATAALVSAYSTTGVRALASLVSFPGLVGLLLTGLLSNNRKTQKRAYSLFFVLLLGTVLAGMSACGTSVSRSNLPCPSCTPAGTSTVQVTATSPHPALQSTVTLQLQVSSTGQ
jgi:hypothetical protein